MKISVEIADEQASLIRGRAENLGVSPEDLVAAGVTDFLRQPDETFERVAQRVLEKNRDLYRRLA